MKTGIVWLKKDLRLSDHQPFYHASRACDTLIALYIYEHQWLESFEFDLSHLSFINQSLIELKTELAKFNINLITRYGDAVEVYKDLKSEINFNYVFAHQETGLEWSYKRDRRVISYFRENRINYREYLQFSVIRKLKDRDLWNAYRKKIVQRDLFELPRQMPEGLDVKSFGFLKYKDLNLAKSNKKDLQLGGISKARETLSSFLKQRSANYLPHISSPELSSNSASRLSPYITYGNISLSEINIELERAKKKRSSNRYWSKSLWAFESRLWWHCHFIQKFETQFSIEFENMNRGFDGMREAEFNQSYFEAWKKGETGYPLIDACMRCLHQTSWINFRMRAMLISFASYQLWLDWRKTAQYLAKHFLDFEPGIHFPQVQMQSGVTGINAIRIYSPVKQAKEQKEVAKFIKKYCPELSRIPDEYLHEPDKIPPIIAASLKFKYPKPIVEHEKAYKLAKQRIFDWKKSERVKKLSREVIKLHASRKGKHFPNQNRNN